MPASRRAVLDGRILVNPAPSTVYLLAAAPGHESVTTTLQIYAKAGAGAGARQQKVLTVLAGGKQDDESAA